MNPKKILIADKEMENRERLKTVFEQAGFNVVAVFDSGLVMKEIDNQEFDGFIIEVNSENGNGLDVIAMIRRKFNDAPVFATASQDSLELEQKARNKGALSYFVKPIEVESIKAMMNSYLA